MPIVYGDASKDGLQITGLSDYTIPQTRDYHEIMRSNQRLMPYGNLRVLCGTEQHICPIKDDGIQQYILLNRRRYYVHNAGSVHQPVFVFVQKQQ